MKNTLIVEHPLLVNYFVLFLHLLIGLVIVQASFSLKLGSQSNLSLFKLKIEIHHRLNVFEVKKL